MDLSNIWTALWDDLLSSAAIINISECRGILLHAMDYSLCPVGRDAALEDIW